MIHYDHLRHHPSSTWPSSGLTWIRENEGEKWKYNIRGSQKIQPSEYWWIIIMIKEDPCFTSLLFRRYYGSCSTCLGLFFRWMLKKRQRMLLFSWPLWVLWDHDDVLRRKNSTSYKDILVLLKKDDVGSCLPSGNKNFDLFLSALHLVLFSCRVE